MRVRLQGREGEEKNTAKQKEVQLLKFHPASELDLQRWEWNKMVIKTEGRDGEMERWEGESVDDWKWDC